MTRTDDHHEEPGNDDLLDLGRSLELFRFVWNALHRRSRLLVLVFLSLSALCIGLLAIVPRIYHTQSRILAQRNLVMAALGNPRRAIPTDSDAPTKSAVETVLRRDNLIALIKQTNLLDEWDNTRSPVLRAKDHLFQRLGGKQTEEDRLNSLLGTLEKQLTVKADEGVVTIAIDWPNANVAARLVEAAQQNFLEARHATEVSAIAETISILEGHASSVRESIEATLDEMHHPKSAEQAAVAATSSPRAARKRRPDDGSASLRIMLVAKRRALTDLQDYRQKRLAELETQLGEQRNTYGPAFPDLANTERNIAALKSESPEVQSLKKEVLAIAADLESRGAARDLLVDDPPRPLANTQATTALAVPEVEPGRTAAHKLGEDDDSQAYGKARLRIATSNYEDLLDRIDAARIELDTARAAFKYRYNIIEPPMVPKKPDRPKPLVFLATGEAVALVLAILMATLADVFGGRILESWQVERMAGVPVLAELGDVMKK